MLNVDKGIAHIDNRWKKLKKPFVQQIQNAGLNPAFLLSSSRLANLASLYAEFMKSAFLEFHLRDARSASFLKDTRLASLYQNAELMKSAFLKL